MSNVILCRGHIATIPYSVTGIGINVYSAEELVYVISQNAHTLDRDFMDEKLCVFIDEQLGLKQLGDALKEIIRKPGSLSDFVSLILDEIDYLDAIEVKNIKQILVESAGLSPARKHKSRGDNLLKSRKYQRAIDEYLGTLEKIDKDSDPLLYGAVLHNLGTAYAKLLLYKKASEFYLEAYNYNVDEESLILHLVCCSLYMKKEAYNKMLLRFGYPERIVKEVDLRIMGKGDYEASNNPYAKDLRFLKDLKNSGQIARYYDQVDEVLYAWKQEYRKNMILR